MVRPPFSVCQSHAQIAAVAVASLASTFSKAVIFDAASKIPGLQAR